MTEAQLGKRNSILGQNNATQTHSSLIVWQEELMDSMPIRHSIGWGASLDRLKALSPSQGGDLRQYLKTESRFFSESNSGLITAQRMAMVTVA